MVGNIYPEYRTNTDFVAMSYMPENGIMFRVCFVRPSKAELDSFRGSMTLGIKIVNGIACFACRMGGLPVWDSEYNPMLIKKGYEKQEPMPEEMGIPITFALFDSSTGKLLHLRMVSMPTDMSNFWLDYVNSTAGKPRMTTQENLKVVGEIQRTYTSESLLKNSDRAFVSVR